MIRSSHRCMSQALYGYVMSHFERAKTGGQTDKVKRLAKRAQIRLRKTRQLPRRKEVPCQMEIAAVLNTQVLLPHDSNPLKKRSGERAPNVCRLRLILGAWPCVPGDVAEKRSYSPYSCLK